MATCEICGYPPGFCNLDVHEQVIRQIDPKYGFDLQKPVTTRYSSISLSPRLTPRRLDQQGHVVADVAAVTFKAKK